MKAIHINSTAPFRMRNPGEKYRIEDFDLLTTVLSVLEWKKHNGPVKLYADYSAAEYYDRIDLLDLWDEVDTEVVDSIPSCISQDIFWAASKLFALRAEESPCVMIDMDLIVWKSIRKLLDQSEILTFHEEPLQFIDCYVPMEYLKTRRDYQFNPKWDWNVNPCNNALVYIKDMEFKKYYTDCSIDFMKNNFEYAEEMVSQMVFAEQRILAMCAREAGRKMSYCLENPFQQNNRTFTHIWGGKDVAKRSLSSRKELCGSLVDVIERDFPEFLGKIASIDILAEYCI